MVQRERCQIESFKPPLPDPGGVNIAAGVDTILKRMGLENDSRFAGIADAWPSVVGKQVSQHTRPGSLQGTELTVFVDSSVWLNELQRYGVNTMLKNLQEHFGAARIRKVRLQIEPDRQRE